MSVAKHNVTIVNGLIGHQYSNVAATGSIESSCMFSQGALCPSAQEITGSIEQLHILVVLPMAK